MSAEIERKCGTCRFVQRDEDNFKLCAHPVVISLPENIPYVLSSAPFYVFNQDGKKCPTWEPKQ